MFSPTSTDTVFGNPQSLPTPHTNTPLRPPSPLHPIIETLLTNNGSVTILLETFFSEPIHIVKLTEDVRTVNEPDSAMGLTPGAKILDRQVLLQGKETGTNYVHAHSFVALENLDGSFRKSLLETNCPIGKLWRNYRVEVFKEILQFGRRSAGSLASPLDLTDSCPTLFRTYRVYSQKKCTMTITETLPENLTSLL